MSLWSSLVIYLLMLIPGFCDNSCHTEKISVYSNKSTIHKGQSILESNLLIKYVNPSDCLSRPINKIDYLIERIATKSFPAGHIFTFDDFELPQKDWPSGNALVVYAITDIKRGTTIRASQVAQGKWTHPTYIQGGFSDINLVLNRIAKFEIKKGQILILPDVGLGMDYAIRMSKKKKGKLVK